MFGTASSASAQSLVVWSDSTVAQPSVPAGDDYTAVAAGRRHGVALKRDGSLVSWGAQTNVPAGTDYTAVAAGEDTSVALKRDGSVVTWGNPMAVAPSGNDYTAIATNGANVVAIKRDGSLVATGWNGWNMTEVPAGNDYVAVSIELRHGVALKRDGSLVGWGLKTVGLPNPLDYSIVAPGNDFTAAAAGWARGLALKRDGSLLAWGYDSWANTAVPEGNDFVALSTSSGNTSVALRRDGTLATWGWAATPTTNISVPNSAFTAASAGPDYVVALKDVSPPTFSLPGTITAKATSAAGATVTYNAAASDAVAGSVTPACAPASGSVFAIGTTTVTCTATDTFANRGTASFPVVVAKAPTCSVKLASRTVRTRDRRLRVTASCTQAGRARLSGHVSLHGRSLEVPAVTANLAANRRTTVSLKLPQRALTGLRKRAKVTSTVTLKATNEFGTAIARTAVTRLTATRR